MKNLSVFFFVINLFSLCAYANNSIEKQLLSDIFQKYEILTRPLLNNSEHVKVTIEFSLLTVHGLDMRNQELSSSADVSISWTDEFLKWNTTSYGGLDLIRVPLSKVWKPDVILKNSVNRKDIFEETGENVIIYNDGTVFWHSLKKLETFVRVDTTNYPFESQTFQFNFSKLYYDDIYQRNYHNSENHATDNFVSNGEWNFNYLRGQTMMRNIKAQYRNGKIFSDIIWQFEMKRGETYYVWSFLVPAATLSFVSVLTFLLSIKSSEKLTLAVFSFISIAVVIRLFNESLPSTSDNISYFGRLLSMQLGIAGFVIIVNVFISCIYHRKFLKLCSDDKRVSSVKETATGMSSSENDPQTDDSPEIAHDEIELNDHISRSTENSISLDKSMLEGIMKAVDKFNRQAENEQIKRERSKMASQCDIFFLIVCFLSYCLVHAWILLVLF